MEGLPRYQAVSASRLRITDGSNIGNETLIIYNCVKNRDALFHTELSHIER
jgi:hypothetical protein